MPTVVLIGTLDTKGEEYGFFRRRLEQEGVEVLLIDVGTREPRVRPDIEARAVLGADPSQFPDRAAAIDAMGHAAERVVGELYASGRLNAVAALGGSGGTAIASHAMRALPIGVPKLIVSTMASGDVRPYVGGSDITMCYAVVDIAGMNVISEKVLANAAAAIAAMARVKLETRERKPLIGATMFGVTTPCVTRAREQLEALGYEVLVFHATGAGGMSMEALAGDGLFAGVLDVTTTELADELVGGTLSAGPERLEAAGKAGLPQVVSLGALDMANFGPLATVPAQYHDRNLHLHGPSVTLMRTTPDECLELGRLVGRKLSSAWGPVALYVPLRGISAIAVQGAPFYDADADAALREGLRETLPEQFELHELDLEINDPRFADAMAARLNEMILEAR